MAPESGAARKVALVTGATRGIGKACALSLAKRGYAVAVTGRTLKEGQGTVGNYMKGNAPVAVPGSIETTVAAVRELGAEALGVRLDILDRGSIDAALAEVLGQWGRIDVLVNNGIYQGPGLMAEFDEVTVDQLDAIFLGIVTNQFYITRAVLPGMLERGQGAVVFMGSAAGAVMSPAPPRKGGWGVAYGMAKGAFHRMAEFLHLEHAKDGIQSYLLEPQMTVTEATIAVFGEKAGSLRGGATRANTPDETSEVVAWLVSHPDGPKHAGSLISAPKFFRAQGIDPAA
jgi:3-oxoacyl-[acyl-carrier protein] reductase